MNPIASIIMAAGRGSRMKEYNGNKTLLPLIAGKSPLEGQCPILLHIIKSLPEGPKAIIVNFRKDEVIETTKGLELTYCEQPVLNGTGGALLAACGFLESLVCNHVMITMGDVPFIKSQTYRNLINHLNKNSLVVLGFTPNDKKQYGVLDVMNTRVKRIIEWKYWKAYPSSVKEKLSICNSGIYAVKRDDLLRYLPVLASSPQKVNKEINGKTIEIDEFFITDMVEHMVKDGLSVGCVIAENEIEAMGVDDLSALKKAQECYLSRINRRPLKSA